MVDFNTENIIPAVLFEDIENKHAEYITVNLFGVTAAVTTNYGIFFIARYACEVLFVSAVYGTQSAAACTITVEKLTGVQAKNTGTVLLNTPFDISVAGSINTVLTRDATTNLDFVRTNSPTILNVGERLALRIAAGAVAGAADLQVTIYLKPLGRGHYR